MSARENCSSAWVNPPDSEPVHHSEEPGPYHNPGPTVILLRPAELGALDRLAAARAFR